MPALLRTPTQPFPHTYSDTKEVHDDQYVLHAQCQHHGRRLSARSHGGPEGHGFRKALIVTDAVLSKLGVAARIQAQLAGQQIASVVFDGTQPNPRWAMCAPGWRS